MVISPQDAIRLPLHDADIFELKVTFSGDGSLQASIKVEVHPDESMTPFEEAGVTDRQLWLTFSDCWQIATNLMGHTSNRESIFSLDIVEDSELTHKLTSFGLGSREMVHFRIEGNNGSRLDFVANAFSVSQ